MVPASEDERRYAVFDVSDARRGDRSYFNALEKEISGEALGGFLYDMLDMKLGDWHPRQDVPSTRGLAEQQAESASPLVNWLGETLEEGALPFRMRDSSGQFVRIVHKDDPALARPRLLWEAATARDARLRHEKNVTFWRFLDDHGITKADDKRVGSGRYRRFPPLKEARESFRERYTYWPEFSEPDAEWRFERDDDPPRYWDDSSDDD